MKTIIYYLSICTLALFVFSCSGPDTDPIADATIDDISVEITSRSLEAENSPEEMDSLLVRKWSNKSSEVSFQLISDNSFEGTFDAVNTVEGKWRISEDLQSLNFESILSDGALPFELTYTIVEISETNMTVQDDKGNEIEFSATK
jgi:hypothetical protein